MIIPYIWRPFLGTKGYELYNQCWFSAIKFLRWGSWGPENLRGLLYVSEQFNEPRLDDSTPNCSFSALSSPLFDSPNWSIQYSPQTKKKVKNIYKANHVGCRYKYSGKRDGQALIAVVAGWECAMDKAMSCSTLAKGKHWKHQG